MRETGRGVGPPVASGHPSLDLVFDVLAARRRRFALYYLQGLSDGVATLDELADHVVSLESDADAPDEHRTAVVTSLQHVHLPKLEEAGILEYDARSQTVRFRRQPTVEELLDHARHKELR